MAAMAETGTPACPGIRWPVLGGSPGAYLAVQTTVPIRNLPLPELSRPRYPARRSTVRASLLAAAIGEL
jgi:hypothetical protein